MPIVLPLPLTTQEMRVLQEFRRIGTEVLPIDVIRAVKHPTGGGDAPAISLASKGFLTASDSGQTFTLTDLARGFLSIAHKPAEAAGGEPAR